MSEVPDPPSEGSSPHIATKKCPLQLFVVVRTAGADGDVAPAGTEDERRAIASMVLGILWICWIGSILALVFGYMAKNQIDASGGLEGGRGMAVAGIVLG
jgi:hypothetical protein